MKKIFPAKLKEGDTIMIIAPSNSLNIISKEIKQIAIDRLGKYNFKIIFSKNAEKIDKWNTSSVNERLEDLHEAFKNKSVKCILTAIGGNSVNQILSGIDYELIRKNPKILCGFSDITILSNAIYAKTGLVTYSGPHFSSWGMNKGFSYTEEYFKKCFFYKTSFELKPSDNWSDDKWYIDQNKRKFFRNKGYNIINKGNYNSPISGTIIGGNLTLINHLTGTPYIPDFENSILFVEHCSDEDSIFTFNLGIQAIAHLEVFKKVKAIVIGRFQKKEKLDNNQLNYIFDTKKEYSDKLIIYGADFGHTTPFFTFPIGGEVTIEIEKNSNVKIELKKF